MDLAHNYFELFGLPVGFDVDGESLALRYRDLQRVLHPDRYANASALERRLSVQQAAQVNEGFRVLKSPLDRARYLLTLKGVPPDDADRTMDPAFLMEQMELREAVAEVRAAAQPVAALGQLRTEVEARARALMQTLSALFAAGDPPALKRAGQEVRKIQFMQRLLDEVEELEESLIHESESPTRH